MGANDLMESLLDGGKTPFELVRDMCYGEPDKGLRGHQHESLTEADLDHKTRVYSDPSAAHEFAMRIKRKGAKTIQIKPKGGKHTVSWYEKPGANLDESITEDLKLTPASKKVIDAFIDKKKADSKKLSTDGKQLDGNWMGGNKIAYWDGDKINFGPVGGRSGQTVQRAVKRMAPKNMLGKTHTGSKAESIKESKRFGATSGLRKGGHSGHRIEKLYSLLLKATKSGDTKEVTMWHDELKAKGADMHLADLIIRTGKVPQALKGKIESDDSLDRARSLLTSLNEGKDGWTEVKVKGKTYRWRKNDLFKKNPRTQAALDIEYQPGGGKFGWKTVKNLQMRDEVFKAATGKAVGEASTVNEGEVDRPYAVEIQSYALWSNDQTKRQASAIHKNLATKMAKGQYKRDMAIKGMMHLVKAALMAYHKENRMSGKWSDVINMATRKYAAELLVDDFEERQKAGEFASMLPKKYQKKSEEIDDLLNRIGTLLGRDTMTEKVDPAYLSIQVIDTINDDKEVQNIRGDGKHEQRFKEFLKKYKAPRYVVQIINNKTGNPIKDNQGTGGKVRTFKESTLAVTSSQLDEAELSLTPDGSDEEAAVMEFLSALEAAQVPFSLDEREDEGVLVVRWPEAHSGAVEDALEATGIEVTEDEDSSDVHAATLSGHPHKDLPSLFERDRQPKGSDMIDAVINGESIEDVLREVSKKELLARFGGKMKKPWPKDKDGDGKTNESAPTWKPKRHKLDGKKVESVNAFNKYLKEKGLGAYKLFKGKGYYYFEGEGPLGNGGSDIGSLYTGDIRQVTYKHIVDHMVSEAKDAGVLEGINEAEIPKEIELNKVFPTSMFKGWNVEHHDKGNVWFKHDSPKASFVAGYGSPLQIKKDEKLDLTYTASYKGTPVKTNRLYGVKTRADIKEAVAAAKAILAKVR